MSGQVLRAFLRPARSCRCLRFIVTALEKVGQGVYGGGGHGLRVTVNVFGPARWMSKIWNSRGGITTAIRSDRCISGRASWLRRWLGLQFVDGGA
jgi:hypothetical protein